MKFRVRILYSAVALAFLSGCAMRPPVNRGDSSASTTQGDRPMDMQSPCAMHRQMMAQKSPAEQQALIDEHMKLMTPQMRKQMQAMMQQCR